LRPDRLILVTGTGTEVGKTWVAARLSAVLGEKGLTVIARKPAQSYEDGQGPTDAEVLAAATGDLPDAVCPPHRWYAAPLAPPMAADALGRPPFTIEDLVAELDFPDHTDVGLVEGAGGVRSPLAHDGDVVDYAARVEPDAVVLVADAGLGTLNAVLLSTAALDAWPVHVLLNRFDGAAPVHAANRDWLVERSGVRVATDVEGLVSQLEVRTTS
jgi:dethiobiotin synthetase